MVLVLGNMETERRRRSRRETAPLTPEQQLPPSGSPEWPRLMSELVDDILEKRAAAVDRALGVAK